MPGLDQGSVPARENENDSGARRRAFHGRLLFVLYLLFYGGFVLLNAFSPATMEETPFAGVNLAVLYGLGLIGLAFLLALFYDWLCRAPAHPEGAAGEERS